jgi:Tol biopolymer transport system component
MPVHAGAGGPDWAPDPAVHRLAYETRVAEVFVLHVFDLDTGIDHNGGPGRWLSWSPDGSRIATCCTQVSTTSSILAGAVDRVVIFPQSVGGYCNGDPTDPPGQVCSNAFWSPDGKVLMAVDLAGGGLLLTPSDGSGETPTRIPLDIDRGGRMGPYGWQPIWP